MRRSILKHSGSLLPRVGHFRPARFANVRNHLSTARLHRLMQTDISYF
jgi:hypothetical protein